MAKIISRPEGEFNFSKDSSKILKTIIETLSGIIDECQIIITPDELLIKAIDPSKICLMQLTMPTDAFEIFKAQECKIGVNLDDLDKILKRASANDKIEVSYKSEEQKLKIKLTREGSARARTFSLAEMEIDAENVPIENLKSKEYASQWSIDPDYVIEAIKDAEIYSEMITIKANKEKGIGFNARGQIGEMISEMGLDELFDHTIKDTAIGTYSLTFLKNIFKINPIIEKLEVSLHTDYPLKLEFSILEGGTLLTFLAPRVEEAEFNEDEEEDMDFEATKPEPETTNKKKGKKKQEEQPSEPEPEPEEPEEEVDLI